MDQKIKVLNEGAKPQMEKLIKALELFTEIGNETNNGTEPVGQELNKLATSIQSKIFEFIAPFLLPTPKKEQRDCKGYFRSITIYHPTVKRDYFLIVQSREGAEPIEIGRNNSIDGAKLIAINHIEKGDNENYTWAFSSPPEYLRAIEKNN